MSELLQARQGEPIRADRWNALIDGVRQALQVGGGDVFVDGTGAHFRARPASMVQAVVVRIDSPASGGGKYNASILKGTTNATAGADLLMPEGLTPPDATDALFLDLTEEGGSDHALPDGCWRTGVLMGYVGATAVVVGDRNLAKLDDLSDVEVAEPGTGDLLQYDGTQWINAGPEEIADGWTSIDVIVALQLSGTSLQYRKRTIRVPIAGDVSSWITWHEGTNCS